MEKLHPARLAASEESDWASSKSGSRILDSSRPPPRKPGNQSMPYGRAPCGATGKLRWPARKSGFIRCRSQFWNPSTEGTVRVSLNIVRRPEQPIRSRRSNLNPIRRLRMKEERRSPSIDNLSFGIQRLMTRPHENLMPRILSLERCSQLLIAPEWKRVFPFHQDPNVLEQTTHPGEILLHRGTRGEILGEDPFPNRHLNSGRGGNYRRRARCHPTRREQIGSRSGSRRGTFSFD